MAYDSELELHGELAYARGVGLRAHASEARIRDVRLNSAEYDRVEQVEDFRAEAKTRGAADAERPPNADVLVPRMRTAQPERQRPWRIAEGEGRRRRKRVAIDERRRGRPEDVAVAEVAVDANGSREAGIEVGIAGA